MCRCLVELASVYQSLFAFIKCRHRRCRVLRGLPWPDNNAGPVPPVAVPPPPPPVDANKVAAPAHKHRKVKPKSTMDKRFQILWPVSTCQLCKQYLNCCFIIIGYEWRSRSASVFCEDHSLQTSTVSQVRQCREDKGACCYYYIYLFILSVVSSGGTHWRLACHCYHKNYIIGKFSLYRVASYLTIEPGLDPESWKGRGETSQGEIQNQEGGERRQRVVMGFPLPPFWIKTSILLQLKGSIQKLIVWENNYA